jgi:hypothetical protein
MLLLAGAMLACGGPSRDGFFRNGVDRLTQEDVTEKLGPPHTVKTPVLGGDSVWTYRVPLAEKELSSLHFSGLANAATQATSLLGKPGERPKDMLYCYRYTLSFNEQKILKQWKREECVPGTHDTLNAQ